ncbi:MAG: MBL fold metallo-hydrolase [Alphaproteobacteria bacterium]|nr:MBL fold metallo-hydrolase [Alphaproteobacteria bacterium]
MATPLRFDRTLEFEYGAVAPMTPLIRRVIARNGGAFTFHGTGTYIVGRGEVAIIDAGPLLDEHIEALQRAVAGETVTHLIMTHTHRDHSPAGAPLKLLTGAKTYGFGPHGGEREDEAVEEGADHNFSPDLRVRHGDMIEGHGWTLEAVHTPGHTSNHLCFALREENALFCGDHVMGWSTTVVSPPDGDMRAYRASLAALLAREEAIYWPTHGAPVRDPKIHVAGLLEHRAEREAQILACLADGLSTIPEIVRRLYKDVDPRLHGAAGRSVLAHLIELVDRGAVHADPVPTIGALFRR